MSIDFVIEEADFPEGPTLRQYLTAHYPRGMPEDLIAVALRSTLLGLHYIQTMYHREPEVDCGRICIFMDPFDGFPSEFRLAYNLERLQAVDGEETPAIGVWGLGMAALELAYGHLPPNLTPHQLLTIGQNMLRIVIPKVLTEEKRLKKLPSTLEMLLDEEYVRHREQQLISKNNATGIKRALKIVEGSVRNLPIVNRYEKRKFSRNFLHAVMRSLDRENPATVNQLLVHRFFQGNH